MPNALNAVTAITHHAAVSVWNVAIRTSDTARMNKPVASTKRPAIMSHTISGTPRRRANVMKFGTVTLESGPGSSETPRCRAGLASLAKPSRRS